MKLGLADGKWMLKRSHFMKRSSAPITVRVGHREFVKVNAAKYDWRDIYHRILTLSWPQFAGLLLGFTFFLTLCFATLYLLGGPCIAGLAPGSFSDAFFFSV
jgi:inward rectifier potassium channel